MLNSTVLEVAISLVFCYASVALITSSINEALASRLSLRAKTLREQLQRHSRDYDYMHFQAATL